MSMYKKILVTLDCSPVDDAIVGHIILLAKAVGSSVILAHVVHSHTIDQDRALKEKATACLSSRKKEFAESGIPVSTVILSGEPEIELAKEIESNDYDLIAMATHGHKLFSDLLFGSVTDYLKHKISVPILLIDGSK